MLLPTEDGEVVRILEADGVLQVRDGKHRTTRKWQAAMSRAAWQLLAEGHDGADEDLRTPIALALIEVYGERLDDGDLARVVELLAPIEANELVPQHAL